MVSPCLPFPLFASCAGDDAVLFVRAGSNNMIQAEPVHPYPEVSVLASSIGSFATDDVKWVGGMASFRCAVLPSHRFPGQSIHAIAMSMNISEEGALLGGCVQERVLLL